MLIFSPTKAYAALSPSDFGVDVFSNFTSLNSIYYFIINVVIYLGWGMVLIAVAYIFWAVIYKLMNSDNEEAIKDFRGAIIKAVLVVVFGLLLLSVGFVVRLITDFFGAPNVDLVNPL